VGKLRYPALHTVVRGKSEEEISWAIDWYLNTEHSVVPRLVNQAIAKKV
jgi:hypothetical protein